jgi:hypothetical protein
VRAATSCSVGLPTSPPIQQRPSTRILGFNGGAKPVNGSRKRGSGVEEHGRVEKVRRWRSSQGRRARGGRLDPTTVDRNHRRGQWCEGIGNGSCGRARVVPHRATPYIPVARTFEPSMPHRPHGPSTGPHWLGPHALVGQAVSSSESGFL